MKLSDLIESAVDISLDGRSVAKRVSRHELRQVKKKLAKKLKIDQRELKIVPSHPMSSSGAGMMEAAQRYVVFMRHEQNEDVLAHNVTRNEATVAVQNAIRDVNNANDASEVIVRQIDEDNWSIGLPESDYSIKITIEPVRPGNVYGD